MKKLIFLSVLLIYFSFGLSTEELRLEVKNSILETLEVDPDFEGVTKSFNYPFFHSNY